MSKELFPGGDNPENETFIQGINPAEQPVIDFTEAKEKLADYFECKGQAGKTAFEVLKENAEELAYTEHEEYGAFISGINGRTAEGAEFWRLDVNGKMSKVGASFCPTEDDQVISWQIAIYDPNFVEEE